MRESAFILCNTLLKRLFIVCLLLFITSSDIKAQTISWEEFIERITTDEESEYASWEYLYEELVYRHEHPYNLNTVTQEELQTLPFLSPLQIENILAYLYSYSPVESISELQLIEGLDYDTRALMSLFVYVGKEEEKTSSIKLKNLLKYGENELVARADIPFYYRKGYYVYPEEILEKYPNRRYLGDRYYHSLRYQYNYADRISIGFTAEKDAGEPFFANGNKGYDFYSYYLLLRDIGIIKTAVIGNYRLSFGQGLVMNTNFSLGKQSILSSIYSMNKGIKKHSSTSESNYFRGLAASVSLSKNLLFTGFYSFREQDATLDGMFITSFKTDGYHRTPLDMSKKNNINNHLIGSNLSYTNNHLRLECTAVYNVFNKVLKPKLAYKKYDPSGDKFFSAGISYRYDWHRLSVIGETAMSGNGGVATLNSAAYRFSSSFRLLALHRYYARDYQGIYASSFGEGSEVRNEHGFYIGVEASPYDLFKLTAYFDCFRFPYLRYRASFPNSRGVEGLIQLTGNLNRKCSWLFKYKYKSKGQDFTLEEEEGKGIAPFEKHTLKAQIKHQTLPWLGLKTTADYVMTSFITTGNEQGYQLSQSFIIKPESARWQCETGGSYFRTDSYDTRVYAYERGMMYSFYFPSYYGHGVHAYLWAEYDINKLLTCLVKYAYTGYFDRESIGTGTQEIEGSNKHDLYLQLRVRF